MKLGVGAGWVEVRIDPSTIVGRAKAEGSTTFLFRNERVGALTLLEGPLADPKKSTRKREIQQGKQKKKSQDSNKMSNLPIERGAGPDLLRKPGHSLQCEGGTDRPNHRSSRLKKEARSWMNRRKAKGQSPQLSKINQVPTCKGMRHLRV